MESGPQIDVSTASKEEVSRKAKFLARSAWVCFNQGNHAEAEELLKQALELREAAHGTTHRKLIPLLNSLGIVLRESGQMKDAVAVFERGLSICAACPAQIKMREIELLENLLICHQQSGDEPQQMQIVQRLAAAQAAERDLPASLKLKRHLTKSFSLRTLRLEEWDQDDGEKESERYVPHPLLVPVLIVLPVAAVAIALLLYLLFRGN